MPKSLWTGRSSHELTSIKFNDEEYFVENENLKKLEAFLDFTNKWKGFFLVFMLCWALLLPLLALTAPPWSVGIALILLSIVLMVLPLPTPQTLRLLGVHKSIILIRIVALSIVGLGISILSHR